MEELVSWGEGRFEKVGRIVFFIWIFYEVLWVFRGRVKGVVIFFKIFKRIGVRVGWVG